MNRLAGLMKMKTGRFDEKEKERRNKRMEMAKNRVTFFIYNMKAVAKKRIPPVRAYNDSEDKLWLSCA